MRHTWNFTAWSNPLAHLVGVYLSDGCVHGDGIRRSKIFSHQSIDREYAWKTKTALEKVLVQPVRWREYDRTFNNPNSHAGVGRTQRIYEASVSNTSFCEWIQLLTNHKTTVPELQAKHLVHLLSAFIDGDGYISTFKGRKRPQSIGNFLMCYQSGICGKGPKLEPIVAAFRRVGVKIGAPRLGKWDVLSFSMNLGSLADSGVCFSIHRKFFKFCQYVNQVKPSTTIRRTLEY